MTVCVSILSSGEGSMLDGVDNDTLSINETKPACVSFSCVFNVVFCFFNLENKDAALDVAVSCCVRTGEVILMLLLKFVGDKSMFKTGFVEEYISDFITGFNEERVEDDSERDGVVFVVFFLRDGGVFVGF
jgi:hypothetical protein